VWATTNNVEVTGSLNVQGTITATELHITYQTSSAVYSSGSTKFGNDIGDTHEFTGSVYVTGSTRLLGDVTIASGSYGADAASVSSQIVFRNSSNNLGFTSLVTGSSVLSSVLGYKESDGSLAFSNVIDGGSY